jgi:molybdate transport system ATP-binding protein
VSDAQGLRVNGAVEHGTFRLEVDFGVAPGEVLGVIGPNGAGKTTLLRALAGLLALTEGSIELNGQPLDDAAGDLFLTAEQRPIGLVFQNYRLFPHLSVRDNVAFASRSQGTTRRIAAASADRWLQRLGLTEFADRKPKQLSGGQAQRVALARALAAEPGLLLLDEPLAALDARTRQEVRGELRRHLVDFEGPTLFVTHDPLEAMVMTDRLLVIEDGRIVQEGSPASVARRPATQYVARLVGLNLYAGRRNGTSVALDAGGTLVATAGSDGHGPDGRVLVAFEPPQRLAGNDRRTRAAHRSGARSGRGRSPGPRRRHPRGGRRAEPDRRRPRVAQRQGHRSRHLPRAGLRRQAESSFSKGTTRSQTLATQSAGSATRGVSSTSWMPSLEYSSMLRMNASASTGESSRPMMVFSIAA